MKLYVDDVRPIPEGWTGARTVLEAIKILSEGKVEEISLDHDIFHPVTEGSFRYCSCVESFESVVHYIIALEEYRQPSVIRIHTANYTAYRAMEKLFWDEGINSIRTSPPPDHPGLEIHPEGGVRIPELEVDES